MKHLIPVFAAATLTSVFTAVIAAVSLAAVLPVSPEKIPSSFAEIPYIESQPDDALLEEASTSTPIFLSPSSSHILLPSPLKYLRAVVGEPTFKPNETSVRVPVLMYHHIRPMEKKFTPKDRYFTVTPEAFEAQMEGLVAAGYHTITPDEFEQALMKGQASLPTKPVLITFDDGYKNQYVNAFPVLQRLNLKATFFIISRAYISHGAMPPAMIKDLYENGMTIGAHTENHPMLTKMASSTQWEEISGSKRDLESMLGVAVNTFAYPYGDWSPSIIEKVKRAGFTSAFWVRLGSLHAPSSQYLLRRIRVLDREDLVPILDLFSATGTEMGDEK